MGAKRNQRVVRVLLPVEWAGERMVWPFTLNHHAGKPWFVEVTSPNPSREAGHYFVYHAERDGRDQRSGLRIPDTWLSERDQFDEFLFNANTIQLLHSWMLARAAKTYVFDQSDVYVARYVYKQNWREVLAHDAREKFLIDARERLARNDMWIPDDKKHEPCGVEVHGIPWGAESWVQIGESMYEVVLSGFEQSNIDLSYLGLYWQMTLPKGFKKYKAHWTEHAPRSFVVEIARRKYECEVADGNGEMEADPLGP